MLKKTAACALIFFVSACDRPNEQPSPQSGEVTIAARAVSTGTEGGKCKVISGANKGKTGTYNADGDCAGDWGVSECKNQDGTDSGKCADARRSVVFPLADLRLSVASVTIQNDSGTPVHCTVVMTESGVAASDCRTVALDNLENLRASDDELDRRVAEAVAPLLTSQTKSKE